MKTRMHQMGAVVIAVLCAFAVTHTAKAQSTELIMFESPICEWCDVWHAEIGPIYPLTPEGKCAPLRSVDIYETRPSDLAHIGGIRFTPTFVLVEQGREVGRILGYAGEDFFWPLLAEQIEELPDDCLGKAGS